MKKKYLFLITFCTIFFAAAQGPIVTVDRANTTGPTNTGNAASISSIGITRGIGVKKRAGSDHTSREWNGTSQATAQANNEYLQWSVTANANFEVEVTEVDIRLQRDVDGPANWQLFYSTDGFATTGTAVNGEVTLAASTTVIYNLNGLSINSGASGTITFRLYAWNAAPNTNGGWLRVKRNSAWSGFGISLPGIRLAGNVTATASNSVESNIVNSGSFDPMDNIDYQMYSATSGLTVSNALKIGEFTIQDGGDDLTDPDALTTTLTDLSFQVDGSSNFAAIALFDGATNIGEVSSVVTAITFNNINGGTGLTAADNSFKTFDVYATFGTNINDNEQFQLTVNGAIPDASGSTFTDFDAGAAQTSIAGDDNRLEVVATKLIFTTQPTDVNQFEIMTPFPIVNAVDDNDNLDLDYNGTVDVVSSGSLEPPFITYNVTNGVSNFDTIVFSEKATDIQLIVLATPSLFPVQSEDFDVFGPLITLAIQDFDNPSPEWTYTNDIPFFDNGWGIDGYYGIIDISSANPLSYESFTDNILGENDLYDESQNGTDGFATITFDDVDISNFTNVRVQFDWQVIGYVDNNDDAQYELFYDGISQGSVFLLDGNNEIENDAGTVILDIPDSVNTVALQIRVRDNDISGYSGFDNFKVVSVFDGLLYSENAWTPYPPADDTDLENAFVRNGTYLVPTDIEINNLYVADGAEVSVTEGQSITTYNDLVNYGTVTLNSVSTTYSSLIIGGSSQGHVRYSRFTNDSDAPGGNDLISAPFTGQTFAEFAAVNTNLYENPVNATEKLFGPFDKVTNTYLTYDTTIPAEASVILTPGVGYRAATSDGSNLLFEGMVYNDALNISILNTGPTYPEWNLIGNPYPSYLTLSDFLTPNVSELDPSKAAIYGYDGDASDGWTVWNQAYADANPNAKLTPGQGFLLAAASGGGTISFTPSMRTIGTTDDFVPGAPNNGDLSRAISPIVQLKLNVSSDTDLYHTNFYITDNASLGLDVGYDAATFGNSAPQFSVYSHLVQDNTGLDMAVQSIAFTDLDNEVIIPLGINATQGQQVTVSIGNTDFPSDIEVYLEDNVTNTFTLLTASDYTFTANTTLSDTGRFFLRLSRETLSTISFDVDSLNIFTTKTPNALFVKGLLNGNTSLQMYDVRGRMVLNTPLDSSKTSNQINLSDLNRGIYVVKLINKNYVKSQKVVIH